MSRRTNASEQLLKRRKFVKDGIFKAELDEFLSRCLAEDGYSGVEVRTTPIRTEIIIRVTRAREVLGERGRRIRELTSLIQKRFGFEPDSVELFAEKVEYRGLCAMAQAESLRYRLLNAYPVRRACYATVKSIMEAGATGCEVIVSGKLRAQRAKSMKFRDGYIISTGQICNLYVNKAVRSVELKQGVLGVSVKIMLPYDPHGKKGPSIPLSEMITVFEPKHEVTNDEDQ